MPQSLLLLHSPPSPVTSVAISAAYNPSISAVVSTLRTLPTRTELLIAVPCPSLQGRLNGPRSEIYDEVQHLLAAIYSLFCGICAKMGVDVEIDTPGSVDARVIVLDSKGRPSSDGYESSAKIFASGPIVNISALALTRRHWNFIFSVDGEEGQQLLADYAKIASQISPPFQGEMRSVTGGTSMVGVKASSHTQNPSQSQSAKIHQVVAVGGTFDHIHAGHKLLLTATALLLQPSPTSFLQSSTGPRRLIVGITGDELLKNKKCPQYLGSWKQRQDDVVNFLLSILLFTRSSREQSIKTETFSSPVPNGNAIHTHIAAQNITIECVEIQDPFGPTITDEDVSALVVSGETRSGGQAVNEKRTEKGWHALEVFEIDVLSAQEDDNSASKTDEFASKISSTAIRKRMAEMGRTSSL